MRKINKRQGLMLCAAGLLVLVMLTVFVRLGTRQILVKRAHMDNFVTQTVLCDNEELRREKPRKESEKIDWARAYPFADIDRMDKQDWQLAQKVEKKAENVEKKIDDWTGKYLMGYYKLAEAGRGYADEIGWGLPSQDKDSLLSLGDGAWTFCYPRDKDAMQERSAVLAGLAQEVTEHGGQFLYIQAPFKVDPYGDLAVNGIFDFTNQNCDDLLAQLEAQGIATLDLRNDLYNWAQAEQRNYHEYFFRTDHHWKPETALRAAKVVGARLREYGIVVDDSHYDLQDFDMEVLPRFFLGSQGKRATLSRAIPDDFPILRPKFTTQIHFEVPELKIDRIGTFEITYDKEPIERRDYYNLNPYGMYGHADRAIVNIENMLMPPSDKKVLMIRDSFCDTMAPFLALGVRNVMLLDIRHFTGSVKAYIAENKPDVVIVMYTGVAVAPIDWSTHKDEFDFR